MTTRTEVILEIALILIIMSIGIGFYFHSEYKSIKTYDLTFRFVKKSMENDTKKKLELLSYLFEGKIKIDENQRDKYSKAKITKEKTLKTIKSIEGKKILSKTDIEQVSESHMLLENSINDFINNIDRGSLIRNDSNLVPLFEYWDERKEFFSLILKRYNHYIRLYNDRISKFPGNLLAAIFGFNELSHFNKTE